MSQDKQQGAFEKFAKKIDIFGDTIEFSFQGNSKYKTRLGGICTIMSMFLMLILVGVRTIDFLGRLDRETSVTEGISDGEMPISLTDLGLNFAVRQVKPQVGSIQVTHVKEFDTEEGVRETEEKVIALVPCDQVAQPEQDEEDKSEIISVFDTQFLRHKSKTKVREVDYLCMAEDELTVQGDQYSEVYQYVNIKVLGCGTGADCAQDESLSDEDL